MPRAPAVFHVFCPCLPIHTTHGVQGREGAWRPLEEAAPLSLHPSCGAFSSSDCAHLLRPTSQGRELMFKLPVYFLLL